MPVAIIGQLEVVEIKQGQGQRTLRSGRCCCGLLELVLKGSMVREIGEAIARRPL